MASPYIISGGVNGKLSVLMTYWLSCPRTLLRFHRAISGLKISSVVAMILPCEGRQRRARELRYDSARWRGAIGGTSVWLARCMASRSSSLTVRASASRWRRPRSSAVAFAGVLIIHDMMTLRPATVEILAGGHTSPGSGDPDKPARITT